MKMKINKLKKEILFIQRREEDSNLLKDVDKCVMIGYFHRKFNYFPGKCNTFSCNSNLCNDISINL